MIFLLPIPFFLFLFLLAIKLAAQAARKAKQQSAPVQIVPAWERKAMEQFVRHESSRATSTFYCTRCRAPLFLRSDVAASISCTGCGQAPDRATHHELITKVLQIVRQSISTQRCMRCNSLLRALDDGPVVCTGCHNRIM